MAEETDLECIPAHRAAFAQRFPLKVGHATEDEAHREKESLLHWFQQHSTRAGSS